MKEIEKVINEAGIQNVLFNRCDFIAQGIKYYVSALTIEDIDPFLNSGIIIPQFGNEDGHMQIYNISMPDKKEALSKWLPRLVKKNELPVTVDIIKSDKWDLDDLGRCLKSICRLSG